MVDETNFENEDFQLLSMLYKVYNKYPDKILEYFNKQQNNKKEQERLKREQRLKELQVSQTNVLSELDKDGNGEVDVDEGNDFNLLLKKHQKSIVEVDRNYVQQFVKISSYLKIKKGNIKSKNLNPTQLACFICVANPSSPPIELWRASSPTIAAPPISQNMLKPRIMSSESTRAPGFILASLPEVIQQISSYHYGPDIHLALA